ncbi:kinase-like protein [Punctularia strigosozonata HHB-11173 SS5]|uniref:kinase-like protein n=1 Tax=Punctularia strigosozonata (strain HHB-11173) TaxID=741275 RepID=UPI0004417950|nr:kinase-like protein [Punctularia strigosozonata HHB-11173 SS5]EIN06694.1 kinase-like protein [Punctularia strigosozonata HHB-11173 SS5]
MFPRYQGGFADIFLGQRRGGKVVLKRLRAHNADGTDPSHQMLYREAAIWAQLKHPNVLPFHGVDRVTIPTRPAIVLPWKCNGNLLNYIQKQRCTGMEINALLLDVATGLSYLHDQAVIHADLRAANILVDDDGSALLTDFGLAFVSNEATVGTAVGLSHLRWLPQELVGEEERFPTRSTDIYAFGHVCGEAYTLKPPFWNIVNNSAVQWTICSGGLMRRPSNYECPGPHLPDNLWTLMQRCWVPHPSDRPMAAELVDELRRLNHPLPDW